MERTRHASRSELNFAKTVWGEIGQEKEKGLRKLVDRYGLSVSLGDVTLLENRWYVTHAGLLRIAQRRRCSGIRTTLQKDLSDRSSNHWVFKATVYKSLGSKGFVGYGDADPSNTSPLVRGAEMRVAETRAVNRALRKAYGIGLCSVEELGWLTGSPRTTTEQTDSIKSLPQNGPNNGRPKLRDRLCVLIRQYDLDANLVKAYAADFCGTQSLKEASRERVESFISHLAACAKESRDALVCRLNSYSHPEEVRS